MNTFTTGLRRVEQRLHQRGRIDFDPLGEPLVVAPSTAWRMLDCSSTHGYALLNAGELQSFLSGRSRKITVASIRAYIARKLAAASVAAIES
jgi:hypothetical protein